jgi:hypothetical protein
MWPEITTRPGSASPRAKSWIIAAIALVLNWTVPAAVHFQPVFDGPPAETGVVSGERAAKPGSLPRVQSRGTHISASVPKAPQSRLNAGSKPPALLPQISVVVPTDQPLIVPALGDHARPTIATRIFDARAPPALT